MQEMPGLLDKKVDERITLDVDDMEILDRLSDWISELFLALKERAQEFVTSKVRSTWKKFKDVSIILCKKSMPQRIMKIVYKSYAQSTVELWC